MTTPEAASPAAGWYADPVDQPSRRHQQRYWDGSGWTPSVADHGRVSSDPLPSPQPDTRAALPGRAGWVALAGFLLAQVLATLGLLLGDALTRDRILPGLLLSQAGLWAGLLGACVVASRR